VEALIKSPYAAAAMDYYRAGWMPLWLPYAQKFPPVKGFTGKDAKTPTEEILFGDWMENPGNVAVKLPSTIIGIDFDRNKDTGELTGWAKYLELSDKLGALPIDFVVSSRERLQEGFTAFFSVPEGIHWLGGIAGVIDIIQGGHRYQVVYPSIHDKTGRQYEWRSFPENLTTPFIPDADSLPDLPAKWIEFFSRPETLNSKNQSKQVQKPETNDFFDDTPAEIPGVSCAAMRKNVGRRIAELKAMNLSRHDSMVRAVYCIVLAGHSGHAGGGSGLSQYFAAWSSRFSLQEATGRDLRAEFNSAVHSAQDKMMGPKRASCGCGRSSVSSRTASVSGLRKFNR
jgi:hypothetical protein